MRRRSCRSGASASGVRVACAAAATGGRVLAALVAVLVLQVPRPGAQGLAILAVGGRAATQTAGPRRSRPTIGDGGIVARLERMRGATPGQVTAPIAAVPARTFKGN